MMELIDCPSPNWDERRLPVTMLVLHYTGMADAAGAIAHLTNPATKVSSHYLLAEDGQIVKMVDENRRAWHAGVAYWRGITDVNSASIGIEIVNPGHQYGYSHFPERQIATLIPLVEQIVERYGIEPANVVGHSDVAPARKLDPGELFPWETLAERGLSVRRPEAAGVDPGWTDQGFLQALNRYGYDVSEPEAVTRAFQRRFRPARVDGLIDAECRAILFSLMVDRDGGRI